MSEWHVFGERHGRALLRESEAREIKEMALRGSYSLREIAEAFGVSKSTVSDIKQRRSWRHITEEKVE